MHLVRCENPRYVLSPHTKEFVESPCCICNTCRMNKASKWVGRLDLESQQHKYTYMVTLTYAPEWLPAYFLSEDMTSLVLNRDESICIPLSELYDLMHDDYGEYLDDDIVYLRDRLIHPLGLPAVYPKDLSNFFKRFNKYCFSHITGHYENIRYFATWEYGPTVYRTHAHLLLWFDDDRIARRFEEVLSSSWTYGTVDGDPVYSNGGKSYVAQYVNMSLHLPSFYAHPKLRQRSQFSKCPPIGSFNILDEAVRDLYDRLPIKRVTWRTSSQEYVTVPLDSSIKSRYFPKLQGYRDIPEYDRIRLYGACLYLPAETFEGFRSSLADVEWLAYRNIASGSERSILEYYNFLRHTAKTPESFVNSLKRWYTISKRISSYVSFLGFSLPYVVGRIDEFWKKIDYQHLIDFYKFQESYANVHPCSHLILMYPDFYKLCEFNSFGMKLPYWIQLALNSFGLELPIDIPKKEDTFDYKAMISQAQKIYKDTHKRHEINAYRDFKLERNDPKLASIVRKYQIQKSKELECLNVI